MIDVKNSCIIRLIVDICDYLLAYMMIDVYYESYRIRFQHERYVMTGSSTRQSVIRQSVFSGNVADVSAGHGGLRDYIVQQVRRGALRTGDRLPTETELSRLLGVSKYRVARSLTELQAEGYIRRRQGSGSYVADVQERKARVPLSSSLTAVIFQNFVDGLYQRVGESIRGKLQRCDLDAMLWDTGTDDDGEMRCLERAERLGVNGIIWWPSLPSRASELLGRLIDRGVSVVTVDRRFPGVDCPAIEADNYHGMREAVEHLLALGHRRIGMVTGAPAQRQTVDALQDRERAYQDALQDAGIKADPAWLVACNADFIRLTATDPTAYDLAGYEPVHRLLAMSPRVTAIVLFCDEIATGAIRAIRNEGLGVPEDVSLVGFNDAAMARMLEVPLTTVHYPADVMGRTAVTLLDRLLAGEQIEQCIHTLPTRVVLRNSTARCSGQ